MRVRVLLFSVLLLAGSAVGRAAAESPAAEVDLLALELAEEPVPDPLEWLNRRTLAFHRGLERWFLDPVTKLYSKVVPGPVKLRVRNFFANLNSPSIFVNDTLQLEFRDAGTTLGRFFLNSTVGILGLFDPAAGLRLEPHHSDFGQTLALAGIGSGPYLVVPLLGPTTARDVVGDVVDFFFQPTSYVFGPGQQLVYGGGAGLVTREAHYEELEALESSAVDYYAALRSAYSQNREAEIWSRREHRRNRPPFVPRT